MSEFSPISSNSSSLVDIRSYPKKSKNNRKAAQSEFKRTPEEIAAGDGDSMIEFLRSMLDGIRQDSREREERYHSDAREREERYHSESQEREERIRREAQEREDRILRVIEDTRNTLTQEIHGVKTSVEATAQQISENVKHSQSLVTTNIWGFVATVLAIVALAITVIFFIADHGPGKENPTPSTSTQQTTK